MNEIFDVDGYLLRLETIILNNSCSSFAFYKYWTTMSNSSTICLTPKLEKLIVLTTDSYEFSLVKNVLFPFSLMNSLKHVHLIFVRFDYDYMYFVNNFIKKQISFSTMIFEISQNEYDSNEIVYSHLTQLNNLHWSRTVQLTFTVRFPFEIVSIFEKQATPCLEHLDLTIEREQDQFDSLSPNNIRLMTDATRLKTFVLRHLSLSNVILLISSMNMPHLNKLTLVDIFDQTLMHCEQFCQIVNHQRLPSLKEFNFLIRFPGDFFEEFQKRTFVNICSDTTWPFNNIGYHLDQQMVQPNTIKNINKSVVLFYTYLFDIALKSTRTICNHSFVQHSNEINRHSLEWFCNHIDNLRQLTTTFNKLASGHVNTLHLRFDKIKTFMQPNEFDLSWSHLRFVWLRCVIFSFAPDSIVRSERAYIINQVFAVSTHLSSVTVEWNDLKLCTQCNSSVKHLFLQLSKHVDDANAYIDVNHLFQLLPNLRSLQTTQGIIKLNHNIVQFVVKIVSTFAHLVQLTLNRHNTLAVEPQIKIEIEKAIFDTGHTRLLNSNVCRIIFSTRNRLKIWLSDLSV